MFALPANMSEVFITVGSMKNAKTVGIDGVSSKVLKSSLPMIRF